MLTQSRALLAILATVSSIAPAFSADWPQWQGPDRNAISSEKGLLQEWPAEGPPLVRKLTGLGGGDAAPAIACGRIYGMGARGDKEVVWALSETDGKPIWSTTLGSVYQQRMPQSQEGPGGTPTVDGDRLYVVGMDGRIACLQTSDGKLVWERSFTKDFGGQVPMWSYRESPLVDGDKVICTPGGAEATVVALNKATGEVIWKSKAADDSVAAAPPPPAAEGERGGKGGKGGKGGRGGGRRGPGSGAAYSSPIVIDVDGVRHYVQFTASAVLGLSTTDGKVLWRYENPANSNGINCSTPIFHDNMVFAASAYGAGGGLVKLNKQASGEMKAEEVWFSKRMQNHHGGMIIVDGCLIGANGGNGGGALICLDLKTGDVLWDQRSSGKTPKGSIALADGRLYYRTEEGTLLLLEPSREKYIERGRFEQPDRTRSPAWAHPVIANGKLYVRDQDAMYCYDIKAK